MSIGVSGGGSFSLSVVGWRKQSDVEEGRINLDGRRISSLLGLGLEKYSAPVVVQ
jgi:hypothetical protein